jgi:hypothetical protein
VKVDNIVEDFFALMTEFYESEVPKERRKQKESTPDAWVAHFIAARVVKTESMRIWLWQWASEYKGDD